MTETDYVRQQHHEFLQAADVAMANDDLQGVLGQLSGMLGAKNREAWQQLPDSDLVREHARRIKDETLAHLDEHLATLESSVTRLGGTVHWADDGQAARDAILDIIQNCGAKRVVKSKSLTTEEIHLNLALEEAGITSVHGPGEWHVIVVET